MGDRTSKDFKKLPLEPGFSLMHWMELCKKAKDLAGRRGQSLRNDISAEEVAQHASKYDAWTILDGKVYNLTPYLPYHPGGIPELMRGAGRDCTALFNETHCWVNGHEMLKACLLGKLQESSTTTNLTSNEIQQEKSNEIQQEKSNEIQQEKSNEIQQEKSNKIQQEESNEIQQEESNKTIDTPSFLQPGTWCKSKLIEVHQVSPTTHLLRFALPEGKILGLAMPGQHIFIRAYLDENTNQPIERPYTPVSLQHQEGYFDLLVKVYPQGKMSKYLGEIKVGEQVQFSGPSGNLGYLGNGKFNVEGNVKQIVNLGMIAAGSGITPMLQMIRSILADEIGQMKLCLIYCNHSVDDIIGRDELDFLETNHSSIQVHHYISDTNQLRSHGLTSATFARLTKDMLCQSLPQPSDDTLILHCGTTEFDQFVASALLDIGYTTTNIYKF